MRGNGFITPTEARERIADPRIAAMHECLAAVNSMIAQGPLPGNGMDKVAERNGLILAANRLQELIGKADAPDVRMTPEQRDAFKQAWLEAVTESGFIAALSRSARALLAKFVWHRKLDLVFVARPGDSVIVTMGGNLPPDQIERFAGALEKHTGGVKFVFLGSDARLASGGAGQ